ncbi:MAG TPA: phytanoyl-CoA dioxygenase family protein [Solirubrobacterales bacterium]|nr:phytanoyl-CoA dioxygenase family protein [Solirubrobacterales bacterium]
MGERDLAKAFWSDGFVLVENAFSSSEVAQAAAIARSIEKRGRVIDLPDAQGRATQLAVGVRARDHTELAALVWADPLAGRARALLGDEVRHLDTRVSLKRPGAGGFGWHQEYRYWKGQGIPRPDIVSALIYLEPAAAENGCLQLIRKSHLVGLLAHGREGGQEVVRDSLIAELPGSSTPTYAQGASGTVLFFHSMTLHCSAPNESQRSRLALLVTYNARSNGEVGEAAGVGCESGAHR